MADEQDKTQRVLVLRGFKANGRVFGPGETAELPIGLYRDLSAAQKVVAEYDATEQHKLDIDAYHARRAAREREKATSRRRAAAETAASA